MNCSGKFVTPVAILFLALAIIASLINISVHGYSLIPVTVSAQSSASTVDSASQKRILLRASARANSRINLTDGYAIDTAYLRAGSPLDASNSLVSPLTLSTADFNEDGLTDLAAGYSGHSGGFVVLHKKKEARLLHSRDGQGQITSFPGFDASPFLKSSEVFALPEMPDYLGAGDFDNDGHSDLVAAARASKKLYFLLGDGRGGFRKPRAMDLPGEVSALTTGEINRADGLSDIVLGVSGNQGPRVLIFEGSEGALNAEPEVFSLPARANDIALGRFDNSYAIDLAVAAGQHLMIIKGRDRRLSLGQAAKDQVKSAEIDRLNFDSNIISLAAGRFGNKHQTEIAILTENGKVQIAGIDKTENKKSNQLKSRIRGSERWAGAGRLVSASSSAGASDDLILLDQANSKVHLLLQGSSPSRALNQSSASADSLDSFSFDTTGEPMAVLPMRLNGDALSDLVVLQKGEVAPAMVMTAAAMTFTVINTNDSGPGSLRAVIEMANSNPGADTIVFDIPGEGVKTIALLSALPVLTEAVTIDGTTQPGFSGTPIIELNGAAVTGDGLVLDGGDSVVRGLVINRFNGNGIVLAVPEGVLLGGNLVEGNYIGTDATGTSDLGNARAGIFCSSPSNTIGGTTVAARNIISGNAGGIGFDGFLGFAASNIVKGNYIGTDVTGTIALGGGGIGINSGGFNQIGGAEPGARNLLCASGGVAISLSGIGHLVQGNFIGVDVTGTVLIPNNGGGLSLFESDMITIGGSAIGAGNIISGSNGDGINMNQASRTVVQGNRIGLDITGTVALGNNGDGIDNGSAPNDNIIGGAVLPARNLISGNSGHGIRTTGFNELVLGNFIGVDITGTRALGNSGDGINGIGFESRIGGAAPGEGNLISGNLGNGIFGGDVGNVIEGNRIGTQIDGTSPLGNGLHGISMPGFSFQTRIGGLDSGAGNIIAFNGGGGVAVGSGGEQNSILSNSIFSNGGLGIDHLIDGVTANDPCDVDGGESQNPLQNFPVLTSASGFGNTTTIQGTLNSTPNTTFTLQFFANAECDPSGFGEGQRLIGTTSVTTDSNCVATFSVNFSVNTSSMPFITATATDPNNNTSEFSNCIAVSTPQAAIQMIIAKVQALVAQGVLNRGQGNALIVKLEAALRKLDRGSTNTAINQLQAFINQVEAFVRSKRLTAAQGQMLIDAANAVIDQISD